MTVFAVDDYASIQKRMEEIRAERAERISGRRRDIIVVGEDPGYKLEINHLREQREEIEKRAAQIFNAIYPL